MRSPARARPRSAPPLLARPSRALISRSGAPREPAHRHLTPFSPPASADSGLAARPTAPPLLRARYATKQSRSARPRGILRTTHALSAPLARGAAAPAAPSSSAQQLPRHTLAPNPPPGSASSATLDFPHVAPQPASQQQLRANATASVLLAHSALSTFKALNIYTNPPHHAQANLASTLSTLLSPHTSAAATPTPHRNYHYHPPSSPSPIKPTAPARAAPTPHTKNHSAPTTIHAKTATTHTTAPKAYSQQQTPNARFNN